MPFHEDAEGHGTRTPHAETRSHAALRPLVRL
jgi:hypothetical protein